jgi:hypothetical protein
MRITFSRVENTRKYAKWELPWTERQQPYAGNLYVLLEKGDDGAGLPDEIPLTVPAPGKSTVSNGKPRKPAAAKPAGRTGRKTA